MKIETRFNLGDKVYFVRESKINKGTVCGIEIDVGKTNKKKIVTDLSYRVWNGTSLTMLSESKIFATIDELTASLVGEYEKGAKR